MKRLLTITSTIVLLCSCGDGEPEVDYEIGTSLFCDAMIAVQLDCQFYYLDNSLDSFESTEACQEYYSSRLTGIWFEECGSCLDEHVDESCGAIEDACLCACCSTCSSACE